MADSFFPSKKKNIFVKTYSKVRPLQTFVPDFPALSKNTGGGTPTIQPGKPFPVIHPASIAPTLVPANSPSSDSSGSEPHDIEMISNKAEKPPAIEEDEDIVFVTLTPGSNKYSKKQNKKKSCNPLQNISNVIKVIHASKTKPQRAGSPFRRTSTKVRPQAQLASIQESDQESSLSDDPECAADTGGKPKVADSTKKPGRMRSLSKDTHNIKMSDSQNTRGEAHKTYPWQNRATEKSLPMMVQGRGMFISGDYGSRMHEQSSTQLYRSATQTDELSTVAYTGETEETTDDSTLLTSDMCTDSQYSTPIDTLKDEDLSDIEIPRDFPDPTATIMKQLTPKVAQLVLPDTSARTTPRKTLIPTTKALPRKASSAWHNKTPMIRAKNSTLLGGLSALNIQEYRPIEEISDIKEENSRPDFVSSKITSTPTSKGRNTMMHQRLAPDVSSIEGDACALPTIDAMQSLSASSTMCADTDVTLIHQQPGVKVATPLSIKGRKAPTFERTSPRMSPRVSFGQYPTSATKSTASVKKNTSVVSVGNASRNSSSSSSSKRVKFLLSSKAHEVFPELDSSLSCTTVHLPELSPSFSILKKRDSENAASAMLASGMEGTTKGSSNREGARRGRPRMTSTPQKSSKRTKGTHMLDLSFDVSAVDLPSCSDEDLISQPSRQTESKSVAEVADKEKMSGKTAQELMDFEPIPVPVEMSITSEPLQPAKDSNEEIQKGNLHETHHPIHDAQTQGSLKEALHLACASQAEGSLKEALHPVHNAQTQGSLKEAHHLIHSIQVEGGLQEALHPIQNAQIHGSLETQQLTHPTQAEGSLKEALHPVQNAQSLGSHREAQQLTHATVAEGSLQKALHPLTDTQTKGSSQETLYQAHTTQAEGGSVYATHGLDSITETQHPVDDTQTQDSLQEAQHPVHTTPRAQLKRSSPNADLPGRPNKKRFLGKGKSGSAMECTPQMCDRATQKDPPRQKRLKYANKAVGIPECIISRLGPTSSKPAQIWQYTNRTNVMDYEEIRKLPQDILETIPDEVFL